MLLEIKLGQSEVELKLLKNGVTVDMETAKYYHDLSEVLISSLDKLLKRNKLTPNMIKSHKLHSDLGADSTSYKIATVFVAGLKTFMK